MKENIYLYFTNDLHSYFEHWAQVVNFLKRKRQERNERNEAHWTIDIGDHLDRVHPVTEATMGKANVELLNDAKYDFATIGNNEGLTLSYTNFYHLYDDATFDVICSNLQCLKEEHPRWLKTSRIIETETNVQIGIIGLTAPFNTYYNMLGWHIESIEETIQRELAAIGDKTDIIVLLSHLGIDEDRIIAEKFPQIDVIIGGHTHHLFRYGEVINETLLVAAGKHCAYVGEVKLTWDHAKSTLDFKEVYTTNITHLPKDYETKQRLAELDEAADVILNKRIMYAEKEIEVDWYKETEMMKALTDKLHEVTQADCAMLNAGLLIEPFQKGEITYKDVHRICPHPINPCVVTLNGDELNEVVRASLSEQFMNFELKGFGFRGKKLGRMIFSNLDVRTCFYEDGNEYVKEVFFNGMPLQSDKLYRVATADTFIFGRLLPQVARSKEKELMLPDFIRELLVQTLIEMEQTRHHKRKTPHV